jgi:hypothetical protein
VVDSLRDGVRVLAESQSEWIKSLASSKSIRNAPMWPLPPRRDDDEEDGEDEEEEEDGEDEEEPTWWQQIGAELNQYAPLINQVVKDKVTGWVTGGKGKLRNAPPPQTPTPPPPVSSPAPTTAPSAQPTPSTPPERAAAPAPPRKKKNGANGRASPSGPQVLAMVAQKIGAAQKILTEEEQELVRYLLARMSEEERDRWALALAPLSVEDAVCEIRREISQIGVAPDSPSPAGLPPPSEG